MNNDCQLLPYIREDLFGFSPNMPQVLGWQISKFDIDKLWNISTGKNVTVAVIDTGCDYNHEDIKDNIIDGMNFINNTTDAMDDNGHGTHVASTIAAANNNKGIVGVSPDTKILVAKALDSKGQGSLLNIAKAIKWAASKKVDFITMSLGSTGSNNYIKSAIDEANKNGCVVFCAAGNSGINSDIMYPAKYVNTISIGSIDRNFNRTNFTCSGEELDFLTPGHDIVGCVPGNNYATMSGTSMSNPYAVGLASLLLSKNKKDNKYILSSYQNYIDIFKEKTKPLENKLYAGIKKYQGYGIMYPVL